MSWTCKRAVPVRSSVEWQSPYNGWVAWKWLHKTHQAMGPLWALQLHLSSDPLSQSELLSILEIRPCCLPDSKGWLEAKSMFTDGFAYEKQSSTRICVCVRTALLWEVSLNWLFLTEFKTEGFSNFKYLHEQEYCTISIKHSWTWRCVEIYVPDLSKSLVSCLELVYI